MKKLIITCDEKWPVFDLKDPDQDQQPNCQCPIWFYREYLRVSKEYEKFQMELRSFYDEQERRNSTPIGAYYVPEGRVPMQNTGKIPYPSQNKLSAILPESVE